MRRLALLMAVAALLLAACRTPEDSRSTGDPHILIGFSMDTLQEERWQRDRDLFVARARELGAEVIVQAASGDVYLQMSQAENMIARGVDVLVVVAHDASAMAPIVNKARAEGVKVVAYDRLITYVDLDFYLAFDNERVGAMQAHYLVDRLPGGRYVLIGGSPTDHNAYLHRRGVRSVLDPLAASGEVEIVFDEMAADWSPEAAEELTEKALAESEGQVDAVIAANDVAAGGVIQALYRHGLAGQVLVTGQNADLEAMRRILEGTQTMTVYKPIKELAATAAEVSVALARGEKPTASDAVFNGKHAVPSLLLQPVAVDAANWLDTVVQDGFHREEEILGIRN